MEKEPIMNPSQELPEGDFDIPAGLSLEIEGGEGEVWQKHMESRTTPGLFGNITTRPIDLENGSTEYVMNVIFGTGEQEISLGVVDKEWAKALHDNAASILESKINEVGAELSAKSTVQNVITAIKSKVAN